MQAFNSYNAGDIKMKYIEKSKMAENGARDMDVEIMAVGTIFQTPITVYTELPHGKTWLPYQLLFRVGEGVPRAVCIPVQSSFPLRTCNYVHLDW